jgi:hypothetical protein
MDIIKTVFFRQLVVSSRRNPDKPPVFPAKAGIQQESNALQRGIVIRDTGFP